MFDLSGPLSRARSCVGCHIGSSSGDQDVNHDLIAAGHPRLNFEYASYLAAYPRHWREPEGYDEAKAWAVGQAVVAEAAMKLLEGRARSVAADGKAPWPEFSEYACFSCHRELPATIGDTPGHDASRPRLPWATWPLAMIPSLAGDRLTDPVSLRAEMVLEEPDPARVTGLAREFSDALGRLGERLDAETFESGRVDRLIEILTRGSGPNRAETWDAAVQRQLGLAALVRSRGGPTSPAIPPEVRSAIEAARNLLAFPPGYDSPHRVDSSIPPGIRDDDKARPRE